MMLFESYKKNLDWLKKNGIKNVSSDEAETVITYLRSDKEAVVDTADNSVMNKCLKLCEKDPDNWKLVSFSWKSGEVAAITSACFKCTKKCVSLRGVVKRELTPEEREAAAERLRLAREKAAGK